MSPDQFQELAEQLIPTVQLAGRVEMEIYRRDIVVETKSDLSPVTRADREAETLIIEHLAKIAPNIPVIAEEAASAGHIPSIAERFFLVDPLDGTKEFINKSSEFTINIALIEQGKPVFGLVFAPALNDLYLTLRSDKSVRSRLDPFDQEQSLNELILEPLATREPPREGRTVVASKSHMTDETSRFIEQHDVCDHLSIGSSLKFCLLARGDADLYPRFGPTMEWDTAAGHAVLSAAGGEVFTTEGDVLSYGKVDKKFLNPHFIAWALEQAGQ